MTRKLARFILYKDPELVHIFQLSAQEISKIYHIKEERAVRIHHGLHNQKIVEQIAQDQAIYAMLSIFDEDYPSLLKTIKDPPLVLYACGNLSLLDYKPAISVIGTRHPSAEGWQKTTLCIDPLLQNNWVIISGLAKGIDGYAHRRTLQQRGNTIAVLGAGFHYIYPATHRDLFQKIKNKGLLLSEYPPDQPPRKHHFPERNRIISGLSYGTLVIEAKKQSGTLITVNQALDQGREVYAVPGSPFHPQTEGCHQMIQDGAKLVLSGTEIQEDWDWFGKYQFIN